jgi:leucyl-tRNA synthetase
VLANEEVKDGKSEIGGHPVVRVPLRQWMLRITAYADRLIDDLDLLDWPEPIKKMQRDWIGRSEGARVRFALPDHPGREIEVFTTRPDTLFGATYMVLAPEHPLIGEITTPTRRGAVRAYVDAAARRSERARLADARTKTGVFTGAYATNPVNGARIPIWIADYVLISYGSGAIMAVPAHDERDFEFATTFELPIVQVVKPDAPIEGCFSGEGTNIASGILDGLRTPEAKAKITAWLAERGLGERAVSYKLRDWLFSRQRYWGEPFPVLHLPDGSTRLVADDELPVELPELEDFKPTGDFRAPLERVPEWLEVRDPDTGESLRRDPNTMPQWAGSCWYYLRFCDPRNDSEPWSREAERYWMPVDLYVGGTEHAVLHLLYSRFWHKVLYDLGLVSTIEPFRKLLNQGMVQGVSYRYFAPADEASREAYPARDVRWEGETPVHARTGAELRECWVPTAQVRWDGERALAPDADVELEEVVEKMSKSRGNVVNPDEVIASYGADSMRLYEMFMGPFDRAAPWAPDGISGCHRFLQRVWRLLCDDGDALRPLPDGPGSESQQRLLARTIDKVTRDLERFDFNTAISALMVLARDVEKDGPMPRAIAESLVKLLAPLAPHLAEELWFRLGHEGTIAYAPWPAADPRWFVDETVEISVQVSGKLRARVRIPADADEAGALAAALADPNVARHLEGREPRRVVFVPGRLINIVV